MSVIIFAVGISVPKLLVRAKFKKGLFDTCLIYMAQCRAGPSPSQTTQFVLKSIVPPHLLKGNGASQHTGTDLDIFPFILFSQDEVLLSESWLSDCFIKATETKDLYQILDQLKQNRNTFHRSAKEIPSVNVFRLWCISFGHTLSGPLAEDTVQLLGSETGFRGFP